MKKSIVLFFAAFLTISAFAQNVQDGVNHIYAERYQSAKGVFDQLLAKNPNNIEASYWLGQTLLRMKDTAGAAAQYQKLLSANGNAPLALVGMGQIDLLQGRAAEAKQRFETAISLSKGKKGNDPMILTAVGRANVEAKGGDAAYAIQKLEEAAKVAPNNADVFLALGNAYRKVPGSGSQAATNYLKAGGLNTAMAMPWYRLSKLYSTQRNWDVVVENLNKAIAADAKFAPAYMDLYYYYLGYGKDFAKAEEYANKYLANTDPSVENDYIKAQTAFVQKKYDEAITTGQNIVSKAGDKANPRVYKLLGYSFLEKGDTASACQQVGQYFAKVEEDNVVGLDYVLQADACGKDNPDIIKESYKKAALMDSVLANQVKFLNEGIDRFKASGNKLFEAELRALSYQLRGDKAQPAELFYIGVPYYQASQFERADSVFKEYIKVFPDSIYGHLWSARSLARIDSTMEQGTAVPAYEKLLEVAATNKERFKAQGVEASGYLAGYHNNIKKDKETAVVFLKRALEFDPTNAAIQKNIEVLSKVQPAPKSTAPKTKTSTSSNSAKTTSSSKTAAKQ